MRRLALFGLVATIALAAIVSSPAREPLPSSGAIPLTGLLSPGQATAFPQSGTGRASDAYAKLPLAFAPNAGQTDGSVRYLAQGAGFSFFFTERKAALVFEKGKRGHALDLRFVGANPHPELVGAERGTGTVNHLTGSRQLTDLPTYHELVYRELWPGIDMVFRGQGGQLKYEFHVRPGANPADIRLAYAGAEGVALGAGGALLIDTSLGTLRDSRPTSFQTVGGRRVPVESQYALAGSSYGFGMGSYDRSRPLVIDPGLVYSTYLGGSGNDTGGSIEVDAQGAAYVAGNTTSTDFPTTAGAFDRSYNHGNAGDVFITKLNPSGTGLVYSTYLGSGNENGCSFCEGGDDSASDLAIDSQGNAYVTGTTRAEPDGAFPTTAGAFDRTYNGGFTDSFVAKLNASGSALVYSTLLGGSDNDTINGIWVDPQGVAYLSGGTRSANFPTTSGAFDRSFNSGTSDSDAFVTKLNASGTGLVYSTFVGGSQDSDVAGDIVVDSQGAAHITGVTLSSDFPTTAGAFDPTHNGVQDGFAAKLNSGGSGLVYSTYLGGSSQDSAGSMALDPQGALYISATTLSTNYPTTAGAFDRTANGFFEAAVTKLNASGSGLVYSTYLGGSGADLGGGIAVDSAGAAYLTGTTSSPNFPTTPGAFDTTGGPFSADASGSDSFITKINPAGSSLSYSTYLGGSNMESGGDLELDSSGAAYVAGTTHSHDFPTTPGAFDTSANQSLEAEAHDVFVTKFSLAASAPASLALSPKTATNTVGQQHCVTATVRDAGGTALSGQSVRFSVSGTYSASGSVSTNSSGQAVFCYTGSMVGSDTIRAFVDRDGDKLQQSGEPGDTAAKTWVAPPSTAGCKVTGGGEITAKNGNRASFGGEAKAKSSGSASGSPSYTDHGPATPFKLKSAQVQSVVCSKDGKRATIFGRGTVGSTQVSYRIDVTDRGEPGRYDTYRIRLSTGYDSGERRLESGNIQVH